MGLYTFIIKKVQPTFAGIDYWILSNLFIALGYLLLAYRVSLPKYLTIILAQLFFFLAGFLRIEGLTKFFEKRRLKNFTYLLVISLFLYLSILYYFTYENDNIFIRTIITGFVLSGLSLYTGLYILKNRTVNDKYAYIFTSCIFFIFSFIFILRILSWVAFPSERGLFISNFFNNLQFISSMVIDISWTTMFFVIHNQKLSHQLWESKEKFRVIFEHNSSAIALINYDTTISSVNKAYSQMSGYRPEEVLGKSWTQYIPSEDLERLKEYNRLRLTEPHKAPENYEFTFLKKNGEIRHGLISVVLEPSLKLIISSFIDITERKNSEIKLQKYASELDRLNKGKDRFLSILAHDLRSPFSALIGLSEMLLINLKNHPKEEIERQLNIIFQTTRRTYNLFEDLLLWSASNMGNANFEPHEHNFNRLIYEITETNMPLAQRKDIRIYINSPEDLSVWGDQNMIKAIVRNLVSNAIKFSNVNGNIYISANPDNDKVIISVQDEGVGISEENQKKLWDISKTFSTYGTANERGTGLGLLLCKELVEKHGGKIWVESSTGSGSRFLFTLPALGK